MVPMGTAESGLPRGVQVVAGHGRDHLCIAVAKALETDTKGWIVPVDLRGH
jgi:Asp-tRNA(Asn)/Glu-tRNA(Gln) amidotransferase A subunit family amidase